MLILLFKVREFEYLIPADYLKKSHLLMSDTTYLNLNVKYYIFKVCKTVNRYLVDEYNDILIPEP